MAAAWGPLSQPGASVCGGFVPSPPGASRDTVRRTVGGDAALRGPVILATEEGTQDRYPDRGSQRRRPWLGIIKPRGVQAMEEAGLWGLPLVLSDGWLLSPAVPVPGQPDPRWCICSAGSAFSVCPGFPVL